MRSVAFVALAVLAGCAIADEPSSPPPEIAGDDAAFDFAGAAPADAAGAATRIARGLRPQDLVLDPAPEPPLALPDGLRVRVVTWNLWDGKATDPETAGAVLAALNPDLVALQEVPNGWVDRIAEVAGLPGFEGDGWNDNAVLARAPLDDAVVVPLRSGRGFVRATVTLDGLPVAFYGAHIHWDLPGSRQAIELAREHLGGDPSPRLILAGDFNDEHYSAQNRALEELVTDAQVVAGVYPGQRVSWPATGFDGREGSQLIDLVFFRGDPPPLVVATHVLNLRPAPSDHKPVVVDLLFPRDPTRGFDRDPLAARRDPLRALPADRPPNLLRDPGAEEGGAGWRLTDGAVAQRGARRQQRPRSGAALFTGYPASRLGRTGPVSGGAQTVRLDAHAAPIDAGRAELLAAGWSATGYRLLTDGAVTSNEVVPYDDGEMIVELLDARGEVVGRVASGRRDTLDWHPWAAAVPIPPGTRAARYRWISHRKPWGGRGSDAVFDDLYLGVRALDAPHARLGGNLLGDGGAEGRGLDGWRARGWELVGDLRNDGPWGHLEYAPWTCSGARMFAAGPGGARGVVRRRAEMSRTLDLRGLEGDVALRWGGHFRTLHGGADIAISLEILEGDGRVWGRLSRTWWAPEWTRVESLTRVPPGAAAVRFVVEATFADADDAAFADELFVYPERAPAVQVAR